MNNWTSNEVYIEKHLVKEPLALKKATEFMRTTNLPQMEVPPALGKFLYLLAKMNNAKRILEIGTFYGYSTMWLAKAVPDDGIVISLELTERFVAKAQENINDAGLVKKVKLLQGDAVDLLTKLISEKIEAFDMIFIDAHKPSYPEYLRLCMELSKPGTLICGDNIILNGELANESNTNPKVAGVRQFIENLGEKEAVDSTALQIVGIKGYDGFTISLIDKI